jgi:biotin carboxyl carrier protein
MKLLADIGHERHELSLRREGARLFAEVDGRAIELEARETDAGGYLLIIEGRVYDCHVEQNGAQPGRAEVRVRDHVYEVTLSDPKRLRAASAASAYDGHSAQIVAQMPGKVVRVLVAEGSRVEAGDGVVVVEAMKMQNEMKSPRAGTVITLNVEMGQTVNAGEVLAVIE